MPADLEGVAAVPGDGGTTSRGRLIAAAAAIVALAAAAWALSGPLESLVAALEKTYAAWIPDQGAAHPAVLLFVAFGGGLLASLSPCILALLPLNLGYMGLTSVRSRWEAGTKAGLFVLGVAAVLTAMGMASALAGLLIVAYRGYLLLAAGLLTLLFAGAFLGVIRLPSYPGLSRVPPGAGPFLFGASFALVSSPCASPVLFAILGVAAASGSPWLGGAVMATYAVAFTAVLFLAGLGVGLARRAGRLAAHGRTIEVAGGALLAATGLYLLATGIRWFV